MPATMRAPGIAVSHSVSASTWSPPHIFPAYPGARSCLDSAAFTLAKLADQGAAAGLVTPNVVQHHADLSAVMSAKAVGSPMHYPSLASNLGREILFLRHHCVNFFEHRLTRT